MPPELSSSEPETKPISIAILALGGEGGGVLANWIVDLGEHSGYIAQTTSVPGVAQRTGATVYYVELFPQEATRKAGKEPVLALMPVPGDVDIVIASELMEAARAVQRGIVTPDRTTLIASAHRVYAISEKSAMGDGIADSATLLAAARTGSRRFICFDMAKIANDARSVISSALFGALAGARVLPLKREDFEETIRRSGVAVKENLAAFAAGYAASEAGASEETAASESEVSASPATPQAVEGDAGVLLALVRESFPQAAQAVVAEGVKRLIDYQDTDYAKLYLERLQPICKIDRDCGVDGASLTRETARYLALWMSYEDAIRVAGLKIRPERFRSIRKEASVAEGQLLRVNDFLHPRLGEICDILPVSIGQRVQASRWISWIIGKLTRKGRIVRTTSVPGFLMMYMLAAMKPWRRSTLRYRSEDAKIRGWLERIQAIAPADYELALEIAECQRLVKGYGDTYERGFENFNIIMGVIEQLRGTGTAAHHVRELRNAAMADESGNQLEAALQKLAARPG